MTALARPGRSVEARVALCYAAHFATLGAMVPFFALWLEHLGLSPGYTGLLVSLPSFVMVLTTVALGGWADRLDDWRRAIVSCNWAFVVLVSVWLLDTSPAVLLTVWALAGVLQMGVQPVLDAGALDLTARSGLPFGRVRAYGSLGFIVSLLVAGAWFERYGIAHFLPLVLIVCVLRALASQVLPRLRGTPPATRGEPPPTLLRQPGFLAVLAGAALINASHALYYTFGLLHWRATGLSTTTGSLLWSLSVVVEIALMWRFAAIARRFSARQCLLLAAAAGALRWAIAASSPSLAMLAVGQALHALTFGLTFLAAVNFIARRVDPAHAARAQSVLAILSTGSMALATLAAGRLYEVAGGSAYLAMAAMCALGALLVLISWRLPSEGESVAT